MTESTVNTAANENQPAARLRLVESAVRLFGRDGFDGTSLRALADDAEVSWGLIRFYFGSKDGLRDAAEELVFARYLGLVSASAESVSLENIFDRIDNAKHLPDDARFIRRALIEERPIAQSFLQQLFAVHQEANSHSALLHSFPDEEWLADPVRSIATRLGYLILAPQIKTLLARDVFSSAELKLRNRQLLRESELIRLGLETEKRRREDTKES
jgi:AcrR family transcriptional regulator